MTVTLNEYGQFVFDGILDEFGHFILNGQFEEEGGVIPGGAVTPSTPGTSFNLWRRRRR